MAPSAMSGQPQKTKTEVRLETDLESEKEHDLVLRTFRVLIADLVQQFNGGHPG